MQLMDMSAVAEGQEGYVPADGRIALAQLERYGIVIIKNAFDHELIHEFVTNSLAYAVYVARCISLGADPELSPFYGFYKDGLASNITALDPLTAPLQINDLTCTSLYRAIMTEFMQSLLRSVMGSRLGWTLARVRTVLPAANIDGRLALHMEKVAIRYPGVHNLWTPITAQDTFANREVPGIQFLIGRLEYFKTAPTDEATRYIASLPDRKDGAILPIDRDVFLYRPSLRMGDVAIFSGSLPHGGHIPSRAVSWRVGCDFRLFPWTDTDYSNGNVNLRAMPCILA